ncbi:MAG: diguanylate cyclase [Armatimonadetes bacterium]|nr:diguanylate cyclase [Armatimonadota bacterium]
MVGTGLRVMKRVQDLPLWPVWVNPEHRVKSALVLMHGHGLSGLGVMKGDEFLGLVHVEDLVGADQDAPVSSVMRIDAEPVSPDTPLRQLAQRMAAGSLPRAPVLEDGRFLGIVNAQDLLQDIGPNYDPLTGLPWSDTLREWGIRHLKAGREITILFFDLDNFREFNKRFGHTVGDRVLKCVAERLRGGTDAAVDHLCRYGGDEFAVGTLRSRDEADMLARWLQRRIGDIEEVGAGMRLTAAVGVQGGRRTEERANVHYAATVDNLINLASRQSTAAKEEEAADGEPERAPSVAVVDLAQTEEGLRAVVVLGSGAKALTGVSVGGWSKAEGAARAALDALKRGGLADPEAAIEEVVESGRRGRKRIVLVVARLKGVPVAGSCPSGTDLPLAAVRAVLDALLAKGET